MPAFKPVPPALAERFEICLPADPRVQRRKMFGCPCAFVNGNMFAGLHEDRVVVRLPPQTLQDALDTGGAQPFEVGGRIMREYVVLPSALELKAPVIAQWIARGFEFAASLPVKPVAPAGKRRPAARKRTA
jgi:TfoX/Sxy family transcriptional regulator of competence genes